jgi:hypothetical protein
MNLSHESLRKRMFTTGTGVMLMTVNTPIKKSKDSKTWLTQNQGTKKKFFEL